MILLNSYPDDHEIHYYSGMFHGAESRYFEAIKSFETAIRLNPRHGKSFFELGFVHMQLCRYNKALPYFQKAAKLGYNLVETNSYIQKMRRQLRATDVTLATCLIVKNEEKYLANCLRSVRAISDEIVVVDTGSDDKTVEIAEEYGARVYHFKWQKDFAAARNFANKQAASDWILQLDADEELFPEDQCKVRELIHQDQCNGAYLALHNRVSSSFGENKPSLHYLVRLFRNREDFYYVNPIHEVLEISGDVPAVDINILHHGYNIDEDFREKKRQRNAEILYGRLKENPESVTTLFYLCMMHVGNREFEQAELYGKRALEKIKSDDMRKQHLYLMLLNNLALIAVEKRELDSARNYSAEAIKINENYLDPYYFLGMAHYLQDDYPEAKRIFQRYLKKHDEITRNPVFNLFASSSDTYLFQVYHFLGKIYRKEGANDRARKTLTRAVELNPKFWIGLVELGYISLESQDWHHAVAYFEQAIQIAKASPEVRKRQNPALWMDLTNAIKVYARVLGHLRKQRSAATPDESLVVS
ncbi:MAG: tetratricopeptide repeat protein [bacterium]